MYEEIKLVVDSGLKMMDALWEATYQVEKDMKTVQNEAEKNITQWRGTNLCPLVISYPM